MLILQYTFQAGIAAYCIPATIFVYRSIAKLQPNFTKSASSQMKFMRFLPYSYAARMSLQILSLGLCGCLLKKMPLERMYLPLVVGSLYHTLYVLYCVIAKRFSDMRILWESPTLWESPNCSSGKETTISISSVALSIHVSRSQNYNCFTSNSAGACTRQTAKWNYHTC